MAVWISIFAIGVTVVGILLAAFGDIALKDGLKELGITLAVIGAAIWAVMLIPITLQNETVICSHCEERIDKDYTYCPECGAEIATKESESQ